MKRKIISQALDRLDLDFICEASENETTVFSKKENRIVQFLRFHRFAACICIIILVVIFSFTTAFAASESFRKTVISIFYPLYSNRDLRELEEGHMTGSFEEKDMLLTFLDRFNSEKMEFGISAKFEQGYSYVFVSGEKVPEGSMDAIFAIVESSLPNYKILIRMEKKPYEETSGIWQIISYQIITREEAEKLQMKLPEYVPAE